MRPPGFECEWFISFEPANSGQYLGERIIERRIETHDQSGNPISYSERIEDKYLPIESKALVNKPAHRFSPSTWFRKVLDKFSTGSACDALKKVVKFMITMLFPDIYDA